MELHKHWESTSSRTEATLRATPALILYLYFLRRIVNLIVRLVTHIDLDQGPLEEYLASSSLIEVLLSDKL